MAIRDALLNDETETLNQLLYAKEMDAKTTWDVVYANAALNKILGLSDEQYNAMMKNLKNLRSIGDSVQYRIDKTTDSLKEQSSALDDILKYVMDLIKWETQNKIKALNDEIDIFEELINLRKQELREMEKKRDFEKSLAKQTKELSKLQLELAKINRDNSGDPAIVAKKQQLAEQIAELQGNIDEEIHNKHVEEQEAAYDKELEIFTKTKEKEIKMLEETISSTEKLYRLAIERISNNWEDLYDDLIDWNFRAGSTIEKDLISAWNNASLAVQKYGDYLTAVTKLQEQLNSSTSGVYSTVSNTADHDTTPSADALKQAEIKYIIGEMKANGEGWADADRRNDEDSKTKFAEANLEWGKKLQKVIGRVVERGRDGVWYLDKVGGPKLYDVYKYHEGGIVGGLSGYTKINPDTEQFAKLLKGEVVSTPHQMTKFLRSTLPDMIQNVGNYGGFSIGELKTEINIQGNADESTATQLNQMMPQITSQITDNLVQTFRNRGIFNKGSFGQRM